MIESKDRKESFDRVVVARVAMVQGTRRISHFACMGDQVGPSLEQRVLKLPYGVVGIIISELINVHIIIKENAVTKGVERGWKCQLSPHR